jgi:hypothetical protein
MSLIVFVFALKQCLIAEPLHPGSVDPIFKPGAFSVDWPAPSFIDTFLDDSILIFDPTKLRKLNPDGSPDDQFSVEGLVNPNDDSGHGKDLEGNLVINRIFPENTVRAPSELA